MKKLLLSILLSVLISGSAFAQVRWGTYTATDKNGQTLKAVNPADKDTLLLDFVTIPSTPVCAWAPARATANIGKDSVYKKTLQTQKGIQVKGYYTPTATSQIDNGSFKCRSLNNENPGRLASVDSLKQFLIRSVKGTTYTLNGSTSDSLSRPAACLFDYGTGDVAFGMWPGRCTRIEYLYYFDYTGKDCRDDFTFDMWTYDAGNTGKTATYNLSVYTSTTYTSGNQIGSTVNVYTTGDPKKNVKLAELIGVTPADLSNKKLYIVINTMGTNNDGVANPVNASNIPTLYDPTIVFDNFVAIYSSSSWVVPTGAVASAVLNHNNGTPVVTTSTDFSGGTAVPVYPATNSPVYFNLTGKDRTGILEIKEGNDGGGHMAAFSFAATGAVKKKAVDGTYSIDVPYTYTPSDGTTAMNLTIPAPTSGSVNDTIQVQLLANVPDLLTRAVRLEITNGVRFWYNIAAIGDVRTSVQPSNNNEIKLYSVNKLLYVLNTKDIVTVYNITGQKVKVASSQDAMQGISLKSGVYMVKTGSLVQKVLVD